MKIQEFLSLYASNPNQQELLRQLQHRTQRIRLNGIVGSAGSITAASVVQYNFPFHVFVLPDKEEAAYFQTDLQNLLEDKTVLLLPASLKRSYQTETLDNANVLERAEVLNRLNHTQHSYHLIVTYPEALCEQVMDKQSLSNNTYEVKTGDRFDLDFFIDFLTEHGFERSDFVYEAGQYSIRGGIVDVFSFSNELPYRLVLDGEIIESIRSFDPNDQLSVKQMDHFSIVPNVQTASVNQHLQTFFDYLPPSACIWMKDAALILELMEKGIHKAKKHYATLDDTLKAGDSAVLSPQTLYAATHVVNKKLEAFTCVEWGKRFTTTSAVEISFSQAPQPAFNKKFELLIDNLKDNRQQQYHTLIFSDSSRQVERLFSIFEDLDKSAEFIPVYHGLSEGFIDRDLKLACYTEHQIFDRYYKYKSRTRYSRNKSITLKELRELKPGDFVTHIDHGIGRFAGLEKIDVNGQRQEAVRLVYKNDDLLYVHINSLHKISKYVGKDGTPPKLNKLGSDAWDKLKRTTKKKVKDIARDLIKLYAARKAQTGFAFSPDSYLQTELEASFMYEDTPDQMKATADFKKDMESPHPMDRLVCGDVGFGKTEIAIRAAFKAVCDSKQVAVLVPTTILANQHYRTFKERLREFPCTIDYINRFKSTKEHKEIKEKLKEGKIDIIIGTHSLIAKDVKFKELGLVVIDEEQKFGVSAKEKLKEMRVNVDTLTLTATPIPRTLHFSLMGARDLSVITTPPPNRQPVTTELHVYNDDVIKEAIEYEVGRGGQVFFVHHRVKDIEEVANRLRTLSPGLRVCTAHGQMEGDHLEDVMMRFIEGEYDVLVATTIIESGLDISNANTIIINNAHMFGLSDLHQMRGRVGRSNKKAFCYLICPPLSTLSEDSRRRLSAIEEFSELGSGFNVAMRDLDIRGSGNLLGAEQSGFIAEIGYDMYHKILDEAIQELKHEEFSDVFQEELEAERSAAASLTRDCVVETDMEILIPDAYVRSNAERLSLYNELAALRTEEELLQFQDELIDRFGRMPQQVIALLDAMRVKWLGGALGFEKIVIKNKQLTAYFPPVSEEAYYQSDVFGRIVTGVQQLGKRAAMKQTSKSLIMTVTQTTTLVEVLLLLRSFTEEK